MHHLNDDGLTGRYSVLPVDSEAAGEKTSEPYSSESRAGGPGDAVSVWTAGPSHPGSGAAGMSTLLFGC